jgi:hypothetical protein
MKKQTIRHFLSCDYLWAWQIRQDKTKTRYDKSGQWLQQGWTILKEFSEKGISGYKVSADDRDAIQELKEAALNDETPFVVEWFAKHGIEVWSAREGQQHFDNHVDKLMNYLRFWQASGESEKTSIRIKSRMQQYFAEKFPLLLAKKRQP